jgi:hypothetical protein
MNDKSVMNDGASVTEFDAENLRKDTENVRDTKARDDNRQAKKRN